jgi:hypothetical protein
MVEERDTSFQALAIFMVWVFHIDNSPGIHENNAVNAMHFAFIFLQRHYTPLIIILINPRSLA